MLWVWGIYDLFHWGILAQIAGNDSAGGAAYIGVGLVAVAVISYLLGSINFAVLISRVFYHDDIRNYGSGNAGTTNMLRTYGKGAAFATFFGDGFKGVLAILIACVIFGNVVFFDVLAAYLAAFFAVLGHVFPCFSHFKGGKGFATTALCVCALNPLLFLVLCFVFFPLALGTHYVSLASVVSVGLYPVFLGSFDAAFTQYGVSTLFAFLIALLVVWSHRTNLSRLANGTERKTYFFHRREKKSEGEEKKP